MSVYHAALMLAFCLSLSAAPSAADPPRKDRHGDALPPGALARLGTVRFRHGPANTVAFSPDGKSLGVGGALGIRLCDPDTGRLRARLGAEDSSNITGWVGLAFAPDGKTMAAVHGPVRLIDLASGRDLWRQRKDSFLARAVAISPDGKLIATGGFGDNGRGQIYCWDKKSGEMAFRLFATDLFINSLAFSPNGKLLAAAGQHAVYVWEVDTRKLLYQIPGEENQSPTVAFSPDSKDLVVAMGHEPRLRFLDPRTGKRLRTWVVPEEKCRYPTFSKDGKLLATTGDSGVIRLWDPATGEELRQLRGADPLIRAMAFSPDGKRLAASTDRMGTLFVWDTGTGERLSTVAGHDYGVNALTFSRDGRELFSFGGDGKLLSWDWTSGKEKFLFRAPPVESGGATLGPGAELLVTHGGGVAHYWDFRHGPGDRTLGRRLHCASGSPPVLSPDGTMLAASQLETAIYIGELATGKECHSLNGHTQWVRGVAFAPDGRTLASTSGDNTVRIWDVRAGKVIRTWETGDGHNLQLTFAPGGRTLAVAEFFGGESIRLWDVATAKEVIPPLRHHGCATLAFSADGRFLATGGGHDIEVWETATGQPVLRLSGHDGHVGCLTFAPNGRVLASGGGDSTVLVWDLTEGMKGARRLADAEWLALWEALAGPAPEATRAAWRLAAAPGQALPVLKKHVRPASAPPPRRLDKLIADLASDRFADRQKATQELEHLGELAVPAMRVALAKKPALEPSRRLERLLARCGPGVVPAGERLRELRALLVLEQIGTAEARELLRTLGRGAAAARLTREARAALDRMEKS